MRVSMAADSCRHRRRCSRRHAILFILAVYACRGRPACAQNMIDTVAGASVVGNGGPATSVRLNNMRGVFVVTQQAGDGASPTPILYMADTDNHCIHRVDGNGTTTTVAGNGNAGYSGNGDLATFATLRSPWHVHVVQNVSSTAQDAPGVVYIADTGNHCVRRVNDAGIITTVAGTGTSGFSGDGGAATGAKLASPACVFAMHRLDASGFQMSAVVLFISDHANHRVRRVDEAGVITTIAGNGVAGFGGDGGPATSAQLNNPAGLFVLIDVASNGSGRSVETLFIADSSNHRIRRVDDNGTMTTVAGTTVAGNSGDGGLATSASLRNPISVFALVNASDERLGGNTTKRVVLYIADADNHRIRCIDANGIILSVVGNGAPGNGGDGGAAKLAMLNNPFTVFAVQLLSSNDNGTNSTTIELYVADRKNHRVRHIGGDGIITTVAGMGSIASVGDGRLATDAILRSPAGVFALAEEAADGANEHFTLYIAEGTGSRVRRVDANGTISTVAGNGMDGYSGDGGAAISAKMKFARNVFAVADQSEKPGIGTGVQLFITDRGNDCIRRVNSNGIITTAAGTGVAGFSGDGGRATSANLNEPTSVFVLTNASCAGEQCAALNVVIYITDMANNRVRRVDSYGNITTVVGNGMKGYGGDGGAALSATLNWPHCVYVLTNSSRNEHAHPLVLFICDWGNNRVRRVSEDGIISTIAGSEAGGFSGDGGPATLAKFSHPYSIAVIRNKSNDITAWSNVSLLIADNLNNRIRFVDENGTISTFAGSGLATLSGDDGLASSASLNYPTGVFVLQLARSGQRTQQVVFIADHSNNRVRRVMAPLPSLTPTPLTTVTPTPTHSVTQSTSASASSTITPSQVPTPTGTASPSAANSVVPDLSESDMPPHQRGACEESYEREDCYSTLIVLSDSI
ncbi:MAG: hypothetical protein EOO65_00825 [Methanosarcinales archaeon]|nr:MAG: hypothetical protein EOO65_00825 [Methanosarcinales archaeon]